MIACQACGHSNPLGRVFCQKCGTKLDLSKVRAPGSGDGAGGVTVGIKKEDKTKKKRAWRTAIKIFDVVLILAVIAIGVLVWQEPPVKSVLNSPSDAEKLKLDREKLEFAINAKRPYKTSLTEVALNSYLYSISEMKKSLGDDKIVLVPEQELVDVVYVRKLTVGSWSKNIVMEYVGRPVVDAGEFRFQPIRGRIGKLPVPSFLMGTYERNFIRVFQNFSDERALLGKLSQIQVEPSKVTLAYEPPPK